MALLSNITPKRTRFRLLSVDPRGTQGAGNEPHIGSGGDVPLLVKVPSTQSVQALQIQLQPVNGAPTDLFDVDQAGNISVLSGLSQLSRQQARIPLTAAQLIAMYAAPVKLIAAPAANQALVVLSVEFEMTTTATAFTGGGIVLVQYGNTADGAGTAVHAGSIPATVITAAAGTSITGLWAASGANGLTIPAATGLYISCQTAPFAAGTGAAVVLVEYRVLTLG